MNAQQKAFHDTWAFNERTRQMVFDFTNHIDAMDLPDAFKEFIKAWVDLLQSGKAEDKRLLNYLMYMTERLVLMKQIMKPTASIYLHCDPTASHYLKIIMDGIFGRDNFINEVVWSYQRWTGATKHFQKMHDIILFYAKNPKEILFNIIKEPYSHKSKHKGARFSKLEDGKITQTYTDDQTREKAMRDVWEVSIINSQAKERRGYPTQKPVKLLKRIVQASSNPGDLIFDPFCGCGTTISAVEMLNNPRGMREDGKKERRWIGVDISGEACDEIKARLKEEYQKKIDIVESNPETLAEYKRLNPYEKQDWLIRRVGGFPNPSKSGDRGIDGEITIHLGGDNFGKAIFSVKTGKQANPEMVRELRGTMAQEDAVMGFLILDKEPSDKMVAVADRAGKLNYENETKNGTFIGEFDCIQILTSEEIMDGKCFKHPPTLQEEKNRQRIKSKNQSELFDQ